MTQISDFLVMTHASTPHENITGSTQSKTMVETTCKVLNHLSITIYNFRSLNKKNVIISYSKLPIIIVAPSENLACCSE
jgi:hypothetical protein